MLYREIIAVCSQIHTKHINTLCGQNVEFLNVKSGGTYSDHWALKGLSMKLSKWFKYPLDDTKLRQTDMLQYRREFPIDTPILYQEG